MALVSRPLTPAIGMEVSGIDLAQPLDDATFASIDRLFNDCSLLLFRDQHLSEQQHIALSRRFGPLQDHVLKPYLKHSHREILVVSNIIEDGQPIGIGDAGQEWHSDTSYTADPCRCSLLYCREVPPAVNGATRGDTIFASTAAAYDGLSEAMKARLAPLRAVHSYVDYYIRQQQRGSNRPDLTEAQKREVPEVEHPVVRRHPITGRRAIYVNESFTTRVAGLPKAESEALLAELCAHIVKPEFSYRHRWRVGDLIIWDNPNSQHLAVADYKWPERRLMHRTTVLGGQAAA